MTSRLSLYNGALLECKERKLAALTDSVEPRRLLDLVWDNGGVDFCLGAGQWSFARRSVEMVSDAGIEPGFGYSKGYVIPTDHIRTTALCSDPYMKTPLLSYKKERGYWFTDVEPIYVGYVSNHSTAGGDMSLWPMEFARYVEAYFASMIIGKLTQDKDDWNRLFELVKRRLLDAKSSDAQEGPTVFPPMGSWVSSRVGRGSRGERGNPNSLIG